MTASHALFIRVIPEYYDQYLGSLILEGYGADLGNASRCLPRGQCWKPRPATHAKMQALVFKAYWGMQISNTTWYPTRACNVLRFTALRLADMCRAKRTGSNLANRYPLKGMMSQIVGMGKVRILRDKIAMFSHAES